LIKAPSADLASRGDLPWRLLVYMLDASPDVDIIRRLVAGRLLGSKEQVAAQKNLNKRLITLWRGGYVELDPKPPLADIGPEDSDETKEQDEPAGQTETEPAPSLTLDLGQRKSSKLEPDREDGRSVEASRRPSAVRGVFDEPPWDRR